jgi:hypothetical protein
MSRRPTSIDADQARGSWKERMAREFINYCVNAIYLAVFFAAFAWYRRFILAEYQISYLNYGSAIIESLILAKVILLGDFLGLGKGFEGKPLIYGTIYKSIVFACFVGLFAMFEHIIGGLARGEGAGAGLARLWSEGRYELLARCLVTFFAFIPFFAFRELELVLGEGRLRRLFFRKRAVESGSPA